MEQAVERGGEKEGAQLGNLTEQVYVQGRIRYSS